MPELLLELFSEEIPAGQQRRAAENLKKLITDQLVEKGVLYEGAVAHATPRRLTLHIAGLPKASEDVKTERKGPRTDAPEKAIQGFLRAAGLNSVDEAQVQSDPKKGDFYVAVIEKKGELTTDILANLLPGTIEKFPWPKSMRWGSGKLSWIRPLRAITATFGHEGEDPEIIDFEVDGLKSADITYGHRFMAPDAIKVRRFDDYAQALEQNKVVLDFDRRKEMIRADAANLAFAQNLNVIEDEGLLDEVAGLVEWPQTMMGRFDEKFLSLPEEVVITAIRAHQKCFCLRDGNTGKLANHFILVSNLDAEDGGKTIVGGNERVIKARLSDAKFFYDTDLNVPLENRLSKLDNMVFHEKLGTQSARVERLIALSKAIAAQINAPTQDVERAAKLAKADLVTDMVFEFPELQGLMGRYYAEAQAEKSQVAAALQDHYKPVGPSDNVPEDLTAAAVALADKLDMLTGFWAIDEKPTGSKDPFALRRAALGVIRICLENKLDFAFDQLLADHMQSFTVEGEAEEVLASLCSFMEDRLTVQMREQGIAHDVLSAVLYKNGLAKGVSLVNIAARAKELNGLVKSEQGESLVAGYRRAANILRAEEKKDGRRYQDEVDHTLFKTGEEEKLATSIEVINEAVAANIAADDFATAISELSSLRAPVDAFFENVLVNDDDQAVRVNRLNLLAKLRDTMHLIANFSKLEG
ncbi:glycine--tRNA ligase subunit beta [Maritalea mediterranea]|uniref:Glycine--tRNA ligase beta subunit n=1 Tax=Maritalea mediterranea TaxID=2909667 RepID=A0ABS9E6J9_9HYPH|nr:glycine--tRNA ligase subunit beta [Maritalea mediterranea]MCF4097854.1 glycine--tRNA ligase subunit beta [Maritalea mediterranea]